MQTKGGAAYGYRRLDCLSLLLAGGAGGGAGVVFPLCRRAVGRRGAAFCRAVTVRQLLAGCLLGLAWAAGSGKKKGIAIPFGPFLAAGAAATLCFGGPLVDWYLNLL